MTHTGTSHYIGQKFCDRYQVVRELGRGGMGVVFQANDEHLLNKPVVIKVLQEILHENPEHDEWVKKKFAEERAALAAIDHPGVVGVLDTGTTPDGKPFLVIQFIDGTTLRQEIGSKPMDFRRAVAVLKQLGSALNAAHQRGICHRDLKPENIMLQHLADGEMLVKIIDFGIATVRDAQQPGAGSKSGVIAGSFPYMAPEQLMGSPDERSDIFALGVIAWEMLTGKPPEQFRTAAGLMLLKTKGLEKRPRDFRPEIPATAEAAIVKALSFEPEQRYQRAKEFVNELDAGLLPGELAPTVPMSKTADIASADGKSDAIIAHVLFMDIVGCSKLTIDEQRQVVSRLDQMVRDSTEFQRARSHDELITLPTGDGMALIFCKTLEAPLACAVEVSRMLRQDPICRVRMGIHSGPVFLTKDINGNPNGQGGGINRAERVMSCGTGEHILLSDNVADSLRQLRRWQPLIHDAGDCQVKDGWLHVWNFYDDTVGNPALPVKSRRLQQRRRLLRAGLAGAVATVAIVAGAFALWPKHADGFKQASTAPPATVQLPERSLTYSLIVKPPQGPARPIAREMLFPAKYRVKFIFKSTQDGYLYLINQTPATRKGISWIWLSPDPTLPGGSAAVIPGQTLLLPSVGDGFLLDDMQGTELVYVIWSDRPVPELEGVKAAVFRRKHQSELLPNESAMVQTF
ncbi:MAG: protein kinase, partial [Acidobacteriota bacterium]|nr:protein kinase [Acidobacteriota bacterium]